MEIGSGIYSHRNLEAVSELVGWAKRSVPTPSYATWARREERAFAHPTTSQRCEPAAYTGRRASLVRTVDLPGRPFYHPRRTCTVECFGIILPGRTQCEPA